MQSNIILPVWAVAETVEAGRLGKESSLLLVDSQLNQSDIVQDWESVDYEYLESSQQWQKMPLWGFGR